MNSESQLRGRKLQEQDRNPLSAHSATRRRNIAVNTVETARSSRILRRKRCVNRASVSKFRVPEDFRMKTTRHVESRSRAASNGPFNRFAPFARAANFPNSLLKNVTTRLDSLKSACRMTMASAFSSDTVGALPQNEWGCHHQPPPTSVTTSI